MLSNVEEMPDHTFNITYMITVENLGNDLLTNIQVTDNLHTVFGWPLKYSIIDPPNTNNTITPNNLFDGNADINLLDASQSYLEVGQNATIVFTVNLEIYGATQEFCNSALGTAFGSLGVYVEDISDNGYISDSDGNGSAGDEGEDDCTPLTITPYDVRFPQAFSPDGDGINDRFMVAGIEEYPDNELTVFNRWGNIIFHMKPYDNTWDGKPNENVLLMGKNLLPQGTYYFIFEYNKGNREAKKGFIVIKY